MNFRKRLLAVAITSAIASPAALATVESYQLRVSTKVENGEWQALPTTYTDWVNVGGHYDCLAWEPDPLLVDYGQSYLQTRECQQDQEREAISTQKHTATGEVTEVSRTQEIQTLTVEESQLATGERRGWTSFESTFTDWSDVSSPHNYSDWEPVSGDQTADYTQNRTYQVTQERYEQKREQDLVTGDIRDAGDPILQTQEETRTESRAVSVTASDWTNTAPKVCGAWSPEPQTVDYGQVYTQTRTCDQNQERVWSHSAGGAEVYSRTETRVNTFDETQEATGTKQNWQPTDSTFSDWTNVGSRFNYTQWAPAIDQQVVDFDQSRDYDQNQQQLEQPREQDTVTGDIRDYGEPIVHEQTISGTETRTLSVVVGAWLNSGAHYACSEWTPGTDTVSYGTTFTQTRDCSQDQSRSRTYKDGSTIVDSQSDNRTITETESQDVAGTLRDWQPIDPTYTDWTNDGGRYGYSTWSPAATDQTQAFDQTRSYSQDQTRYEQQREQDQATGTIRNSGNPVLQTQTVTGTESRTVSVSWSDWADVGTHQNCAAWSPEASTVNYGEAFTQSRDCDQDQTRNRLYAVGTDTINSVAENRTIKQTETQQSTGTNRDWQPIESTYTQWLNAGAPYAYQAWTPQAISQTTDFDQTRSYSQDQERYEQKRERDAITGDVRAVGDPILHQQTITGSETRSLTVSWTDWVNSGSHHNCSTWTPDPSTVDYGNNFTQTRSCDQDLTRERVYKDGANVVVSKTETKTVQETESRTSTGTFQDWRPIESTYTSWADDGGPYGFTYWTPAPSTETQSFEQTRTYKQDQTRYEQKREQDSVTSSIRNVGSPIAQTQTLTKTESRTITVQWSNWTNNGDVYDCSAWTPDSITIPSGQAFTQTRSCSQEQVRDRIYKNGTATIDTTQESQVISVDQSRQSTGTYQDWQPTTSTYTAWVDEGTPTNYGEWQRPAGFQTANFTQTRTYDQPQSRFEQQREKDVVTGDIRTVGDPIKRTRMDQRSESRSVVVTYGNWENSGIHYDCTAWSPLENTVPNGQVYTQTRDCQQNQVRNRVYTVDGATIATSQETKTIVEEEGRQATGTLTQWQPTTPTYTAWVNDGAMTNFKPWSPAPTSQMADFVQSQTYDQPQSRYRQNREEDLISGDIRDSGDPVLETRMLESSRDRTVSVSWSAWVNNGADTNCSAWSPDPATVDMGQSFTQTRDCSEPQTRNRIYTYNGVTLNTLAENRMNPVTRSRTATGTRQDWMPTTSTFTAWTNDGARYGYTSWYPTPSTQTSDFTQSRSYSQDQTRYEQKREQDTITGQYRDVGDPILRNRTITGNESRSVTVSWTNWVDSGSPTNCTAWSPDPSTVADGQAFTQTHTCDQAQVRNRVYKVGSTTLNSSQETRTISVDETQQATGTMSNWQPTTSTFTAWIATGNHSFTAWTPATGTQTSNFTQTRSYKQDQERYEQQREYDTITGNYRNVGSPILRTQTVDKSQSRTVAVSYTSWIRESTSYTCSSWSPSTSTVTSGQTFTQTQTCYFYEHRDRRYDWNTTRLDTVQETRSVSTSSSRTATGTYVSSGTGGVCATCGYSK